MTLDEAVQRLEAAVIRLEAIGKPAAIGGGAVFPNYGKAKGLPVVGASLQDLEYYKQGALRTLGDPEKERFHAKERGLLAAIDAELKRAHGIVSEPQSETEDRRPEPPHNDDIPF